MKVKIKPLYYAGIGVYSSLFYYYDIEYVQREVFTMGCEMFSEILEFII